MYFIIAKIDVILTLLTEMINTEKRWKLQQTRNEIDVPKMFDFVKSSYSQRKTLQATKIQPNPFFAIDSSSQAN